MLREFKGKNLEIPFTGTVLGDYTTTHTFIPIMYYVSLRSYAGLCLIQARYSNFEPLCIFLSSIKKLSKPTFKYYFRTITSFIFMSGSIFIDTSKIHYILDR